MEYQSLRRGMITNENVVQLLTASRLLRFILLLVLLHFLQIFHRIDRLLHFQHRRRLNICGLRQNDRCHGFRGQWKRWCTFRPAGVASQCCEYRFENRHVVFECFRESGVYSGVAESSGTWKWMDFFIRFDLTRWLGLNMVWYRFVGDVVEV